MNTFFGLAKKRAFGLLMIVIGLSVWFTVRAAAWETPYATLTIYAFGDEGAAAASGEQGHTWLTITNTSRETITFLDYEIEPGEEISISIWPDSSPNTGGYGGVFINLETVVDKGVNCTSYSISLTEDQVKQIEAATPKESYYHDGQEQGLGINITDDLWHNCTTYSTKMWNMVADDDHQISNGTLGVDVPGTVASKIAKWSGSKNGKYQPKTTYYWADVIHITKDKKVIAIDKIELSDSSKTLFVDDTFELTAKFSKTGDGKRTIVFSSGNSAVASVSRTGTVKAKKEGTCKITASYGSVKTTCSIKVKKEKITLSKSSASLYLGKKLQLKAKVTAKSKKVTWSSSKESVATVSSTGWVKAVKAGTAVITASCSKVKASCKITVTDYRAIYRKALEKGTFSYKEANYSGTINAKYFLLVNIDQKGVPELIVCPDLFPIGHSGYIYTVRNGKLKYCGSYSHKGYQKFMYVKKYKSVYYSWWTNGIGGAGAQLLKINSNGNLKPYKYFYECQENMYSTKRLYYSGKSGIKDSKTVSKSKYKKLTRKYLGKIKSYAYKANTAANRKKLLK